LEDKQPRIPVDTGQDQLKYPSWQLPLQDLMLEFDRTKLREKMQSVEALIFERLQQLPDGNNSLAERVALNNALSALRVLQREKLNFPDWK
jgi:hypothetical protein